MDLLLGAGIGAAVALIFNLFRDAMQRRWAVADARRLRADERSDAAAADLIALLDDLCDPFDGLWDHGADANDERLKSAARAVRRKSLLLRSDVVRSRVEAIADCAIRYSTIEQHVGDRPSQIGYRLRHEGRQALGATLRGDAVGSSETIEGYLVALAEADEFYAWVEKQQRAERRAAAEAAASSAAPS